MAFDHATIIAAGVERARAKLEYSTAATAFVPVPFTIADLPRVYEATWGVSLDPANFGRKVRASAGFIEPTWDERSVGVGKPAALFRPGPGQWLAPPLTRPEP